MPYGVIVVMHAVARACNGNAGRAMVSALGRDEDLELASSDFLGQADDLRAQAEQELRDVGEDLRESTALWGTDATGAVSVSVDRRGLVQDVHIVGDWRQLVHASVLGEALFQAYTWAVRTAVTAEAVSALGRPTGVAPPGAAEWPPPPDEVGDWRAATWGALNGVEAELARIRRARSDPQAVDDPPSRTVSPGGFFVLEARGAGVLGISGRAALIAAADVGQLRRDALALLRAARSSAADREAAANAPGDFDGRA